MKYPSATILADACFQDYIRLNDDYNKVYDKLNVALAFSGIILTVIFETLDLDFLFTKWNNQEIWKCVLIGFHTICLCISITCMFVGILILLLLLKGRNIPMFKSEDVRNDEIYRTKEEDAALWLIDKYTICTNSIRPILAEKQAKFEQGLSAMTIGLVLYTLSVLLGKVGF